MPKHMLDRTTAYADLKRQLMESELAAGEQKNRILALREENATLRAQLAEYQAKSAAVGDAMICAARAAEAMRMRAEQQSMEIMRTAQDRCQREEQRLKELSAQLGELRLRCHAILAAISDGLEESGEPSFGLAVSGED